MPTATKVRTCSHCNEQGHNIRACPWVGKQIRRCGSCQGLGHNARTCPGETGKSKQKKATKAVAKVTARLCSVCQETGHNSRTCAVAKPASKPAKTGKADKAKATATVTTTRVAAPKKRPRGAVLATFPSTTNPEANHEVRRGLDGKVYCTCPGWRMAKKRNGAAKERKCWHLDTVLPSLT